MISSRMEKCGMHFPRRHVELQIPKALQYGHVHCLSGLASLSVTGGGGRGKGFCCQLGTTL